MPKRRTAKNRRPALTPALRPLAERLVALNEAHLEAIRSENHPFYSDGRREEMARTGSLVRKALAIRPWDDQDAILRAALADWEAR